MTSGETKKYVKMIMSYCCDKIEAMHIYAVLHGTGEQDLRIKGYNTHHDTLLGRRTLPQVVAATVEKRRKVINVQEGAVNWKVKDSHRKDGTK